MDSFSSNGLPACLLAALQNKHAAVVEFLPSRGLSIRREHVHVVVDHEDTTMLQMFLDQGWDINKIENISQPPALA